MTVVILEDAAQDIESGRQFYESREPGIGGSDHDGHIRYGD